MDEALRQSGRAWDYADSQGLYREVHAAGGMGKFIWEDDPKRLLFGLARYKHVAKLLAGKHRVLEVGCGDGYFSRIVRQSVPELVAVDLDKQSIAEAKANLSPKWPITFVVADITKPAHILPYSGIGFNATYCLDVLEHIKPEEETVFLRSMCKLAPVCIVGTPSKESQVYASRLSKAGHVNCKSGEELRETMRMAGGFDEVFMFSMNDEALGTGYLPMAHYLLAVCVRR